MSPESLSPHPDQTQEELRPLYQQRLNSLKDPLHQGRDQYAQDLKNGLFDDQEGEEPGQGEKRQEEAQQKLLKLLAQAQKLKALLDSGEPLPQLSPVITTPFTYTNPDTNQVELQETITLDLEAKLQSTLAFYQSINLDIPPDFEDQIRDIWSRHQDEIEQAIATQGFNDLLLLPPTPNLPDLANKTEMEQGYWTSDNFTEGGGFAQAKSQNTNQTRLLLVHHTQNLQDHPLLKQTLNIKGQDVNLSEALTLEDYLLFQRQYFAQNNKHLDEDGWTWLATHSGPRLVCARWFPGDHRLRVDAGDLTSQDGYLGVRPTRCFL